MNYEKFKEAMNREDYSGMNEISAFALEQPERYERFRENGEANLMKRYVAIIVI